MRDVLLQMIVTRIPSENFPQGAKALQTVARNSAAVRVRVKDGIAFLYWGGMEPLVVPEGYAIDITVARATT